MHYKKAILNVNVDFGLNYADVLNIIDQSYLKDGLYHYICTTNPEFIIDAQKDTEFKHIINSADLSVPDGSGVLFAEKYFTEIENINKDILFPIKAFIKGIKVGLHNKDVGTPLTGVDLTYKLLELANEKHYSIVILGGRYRDSLGKGVIDKRDLAKDAAIIIGKKYPGIKIVSSTSQFSYKDKDDDSTLAYIHKCMNECQVTHIDLLFVGYNHINQEKWIVRNASKIPAKVSLGIGGTFDYIVGAQKRESDTVRGAHMGWLYRLVTQPWRIGRISKAFPTFPLKIFLSSIK